MKDQPKPKAQKIDYSTILVWAFNNQKSLKIRYKGAWRTIDPYSLDKTYVVAYCHLARDIRTFRVDKVQGAEVQGPFSPDKALVAVARARLTDAPNHKVYGGHFRRF